MPPESAPRDLTPSCAIEMKIVVTGSSGSVGSGIVSYILEHTTHTVLLVDRIPPSAAEQETRATFVAADLRDFETWAGLLKGADALIHLAGYAQPFLAHPAVIHATNTQLSFNALQGAAEAGIKHVVMASR